MLAEFQDLQQYHLVPKLSQNVPSSKWQLPIIIKANWDIAVAKKSGMLAAGIVLR